MVEGEIEAGKRYEEKDFNKIIEIKEREAYRVKLLMGMIDQREKTLVFCATQAHALAVRDLINQTKTSTDPIYCVRVTANDGALGDQYLRDFQDNEKTIPTILTTSQKLSTGVDARNVRNIVLMRPDQLDDRVQADHRPRHAPVRRQGLLHDLRLREGAPPLQRPGVGRRAAGAGAARPPAAGAGRRRPIEPADEPPPEPPTAAPRKIKVKLADGKERTIQHMTATTFWSADGRPMSAAQFLESAVRRAARVLQGRGRAAAHLERPGHPQGAAGRPGRQGLRPRAAGRDAEDHRGREQRPVRRAGLRGVRRDAGEPRAERAAAAQAAAAAEFTDKQQAFVDFVLAQYVKQGVDELDAEKLSPLLRLRYRALPDAFAQLGRPEQVRGLFVDMQKHLYAGPADRR